MTRIIQKELDKAEEYVLNKLFGDARNPIISKKIQLFLVAKKIEIFEEFAKDFITDDGYFDGEQIAKLLIVQFPELRGLTLPNMKPIELAKTLDNLIGFDSLGNIIQNL